MACLVADSERAIPAVCGIGDGDGIGCVLVPERYAGVRELLRMKGAAELVMPECLRVEGERIVGDCGGVCMTVGSGQFAVCSGERDVGSGNRFPSGNRSYNGEAPGPEGRACNGRDMSVREAVANLGGRIDRVGRNYAELQRENLDDYLGLLHQSMLDNPTGGMMQVIQTIETGLVKQLNPPN